MRINKSEIEILLTLAKTNEWTNRSDISKKFSQQRTSTTKYLNSLMEKKLIEERDKTTTDKYNRKSTKKEWRIKQDLKTWWTLYKSLFFMALELSTENFLLLPDKEIHNQPIHKFVETPYFQEISKTPNGQKLLKLERREAYEKFLKNSNWLKINRLERKILENNAHDDKKKYRRETGQ